MPSRPPFIASITFVVLLTIALSTVQAHGPALTGDKLEHYRRAYKQKHHDLSKRCGSSLRRRQLQRSAALAMGKRDLFSTQLFQHYRTRQSSTDNSTSSSDNTTSACLLTPEVTQGPYHVLGELVQQDIRGGQGGVPLHLVVDFVDVDTCEPLTNAYIDVWSANSTGHYSGYGSSNTAGGGGGGGNSTSSSSNSTQSASLSSSVTLTGSATGSTMTGAPTGSAASGGGGGGGMTVNSATIDSYTAGADQASNGSTLASNPTDTDNFLRGIWQTDDEGVLTMFTIVPGWYQGRAPHIHLKVYEESAGYRAENGSFIANSTAHHTGQFFIDDTTMDAVAATTPYSANTLSWDSATKNADDGIYPYANSMGTNANLEITYINASDISFGLIGTTVVGINMTYASAELTTAYWDP